MALPLAVRRSHSCDGGDADVHHPPITHDDSASTTHATATAGGAAVASRLNGRSSIGMLRQRPWEQIACARVPLPWPHNVLVFVGNTNDLGRNGHERWFISPDDNF